MTPALRIFISALVLFTAPLLAVADSATPADTTRSIDCERMTSQQCESIERQYLEVLNGPLRGEIQDALRRRGSLVVARDWRRRSTTMAAAEFVTRLDTLLAGIRNGTTRVRFVLDTSVDIAMTNATPPQITIGEVAFDSCLGAQLDPVECAATLAHETIHLVPDDNGGVLALDTPRRRYNAVLGDVPSYVAQGVACRWKAAQTSRTVNCDPSQP